MRQLFPEALRQHMHGVSRYILYISLHVSTHLPTYTVHMLPQASGKRCRITDITRYVDFRLQQETGSRRQMHCAGDPIHLGGNNVRGK